MADRNDGNNRSPAEVLGVGAAVQEIAALARRERMGGFFRAPQGPCQAYLSKPDGTLELVEVPPPPRKHVFHAVRDFKRFVMNAHTNRLHGADPKTMTVWLSDKGIGVVLDDAKRSDRAMLPFTPTEHFALVDGPELAKWRGQTDMVAFVRDSLCAVLAEESRGLLSTLRSLKFESATQRSGEVQQNATAVSMSVKREVTGANKLPETVKLNIRLFDALDLRRTRPIYCALDVDIDKGVMRLVPITGSIDEALEAELAEIEESLQDLPCPVYVGEA